MIGINQSHLASMATRVTTTSAMNPILMLVLMVAPLSFMVSLALFHLNQAVAGSFFAVVGAIPILLAGWQACYFTIKDPKRLQREQHLENMFAIESKIGVKSEEGIREIPISSTGLTDNPQIEGPRGE